MATFRFIIMKLELIFVAFVTLLRPQRLVAAAYDIDELQDFDPGFLWNFFNSFMFLISISALFIIIRQEATF